MAEDEIQTEELHKENTMDKNIADPHLVSILKEHAVSANHWTQDQQIIAKYIALKKETNPDNLDDIRSQAIALYNTGPMAFRFEHGNLVRGPGNKSCQLCGYVNHVRVAACRGCNGTFIPSRAKAEAEPKWQQKCRICGLPRRGHVCPVSEMDVENSEKPDKIIAQNKETFKRKVGPASSPPISLANPPVFTYLSRKGGKKNKLTKKKEYELCQRLLQDAQTFSACLNKRISELKEDLADNN